jgi:Tfp pilus assembly protein PilN
MTEVRQSLARAISALADEVEGPEESMRPAQRLGQLGLDLAALGREIAELTETHQARLAVTSHRLAIRNTRSGVVEQLGELARVLPGRNGGRFLRGRTDRRRRVGP